MMAKSPATRIEFWAFSVGIFSDGGSRNDFGALRQLLAQLQQVELGRGKNGKGSEVGKRD